MSKMNDTINDKITKNIHAQLMDLLPEDEIRAKVDYEIEEFFKTKKTSYGSTEPSQFSVLVQSLLKDKITTLIRNVFDSDYWKIEVNEALEVTIGTSLQNVLGIEPNALRNAVTKDIALSKARDLLMLLKMSVNSYGDPSLIGVAKAIDTAVAESLDRRKF